MKHGVPEPKELVYFNKKAKRSTVEAIHNFYYSQSNDAPVTGRGGCGRKPVEIVNDLQWWWLWENSGGPMFGYDSGYPVNRKVFDVIEGYLRLDMGQSKSNAVSLGKIISVYRHLDLISSRNIQNYLKVSSRHSRRIMWVVKASYPHILPIINADRVKIESYMTNDSEWEILSDSVIYKDSNGVLRVDPDGILNDEFFD